MSAPAASSQLILFVQSAARGDLGAFRLLHAAVAANLLRVIRRVCRDDGLADEVLQDAFMKIWRGAASFDERVATPMTWMMAIARNAAIDACRKAALQPVTTPELEEDAPELAIELPEGHADQIDDLSRCLQCLPAIRRECLLLAYLGGYRRQELAEHFDRPVGTIKIWLHRSVARLRDCLGGEKECEVE